MLKLPFMKNLLLCWWLCATGLIYAQDIPTQELPPTPVPDSLYREDQFYMSFTYNLLGSLPDGHRQNKFSAGLTAGFLRDMPINKERTISIAAGLGYGMQNYNHNLVVEETPLGLQYRLLGRDIFYEKNKLSLHYAELPIEFRWRNSTAESHKFWRVYTGVKLSYLFYSRSKFVGDEVKFIVQDNPDLARWRVGVYMAAGYNTWNFYAYYGLNPIFSDAVLDGEPVDLRTISLGLMFYIL